MTTIGFVSVLLGMFSAASTSTVQGGVAQTVDFSRHYRKGLTTAYDLAVVYTGGSPKVSGHIEETLQSLQGDTAAVRFRATSIDAGGGVPQFEGPLPDLTATVGKNGLPKDVSFSGPPSLIVLLCLAGITTNSSVKTGDDVTAAWADGSGLKVDAKGKVLTVDSSKGVLTVTWDETWTTKSGVKMDFPIKSIYDIADMSLSAAEEPSIGFSVGVGGKHYQ